MTIVDRIQALLKPQPLAPPQTQASVYMSTYRSLHPGVFQVRPLYTHTSIQPYSETVILYVYRPNDTMQQ